MALRLIAGGATVLHQKPASLSVGLGHALFLNGLDVVAAHLGQAFGKISHVVPVAYPDGRGNLEAVLHASWCHWCFGRAALANGAVGVSSIGIASGSGTGGVVVVACIVVIILIVVALVPGLVAVSSSASLLPDFSWDFPETSSLSREMLSSA